MNDHHFTIGLSTGVSLYPKDATTVEMLIRNSDAAMYAAKGRKGNNFEF